MIVLEDVPAKKKPFLSFPEMGLSILFENFIECNSIQSAT